MGFSQFFEKKIFEFYWIYHGGNHFLIFIVYPFYAFWFIFFVSNAPSNYVIRKWPDFFYCKKTIAETDHSETFWAKRKLVINYWSAKKLLAYPKKHNKAIRLYFILKNMSSLIETKFKFNLFQFSTFLSAKFRQTAAFVIWLCSSQYANLFKCWTLPKSWILQYIFYFSSTLAFFGWNSSNIFKAKTYFGSIGNKTLGEIQIYWRYL